MVCEDFPHPPSSQGNTGLTKEGERDPGSSKSRPQITAMERCWGALGEEHLLCERAGECGSDP